LTAKNKGQGYRFIKYNNTLCAIKFIL